MIVHIQFSDDKELEIVSYFNSPQDPDVWSNIADVDTTDSRYKVFWERLDVISQMGMPSPDLF